MGKISKNTSVSLLMSNNKTSNSLKKKRKKENKKMKSSFLKIWNGFIREKSL